mmetsp:Transcript_45376/g.107619  ORF Transcript_45376/g.107619 Transcript_45376/m.107619 type:complete len:213 (-) Transcript_45376:461-1099(-)
MHRSSYANVVPIPPPLHPRVVAGLWLQRGIAPPRPPALPRRPWHTTSTLRLPSPAGHLELELDRLVGLELEGPRSSLHGNLAVDDFAEGRAKALRALRAHVRECLFDLGAALLDEALDLLGVLAVQRLEPASVDRPRPLVLHPDEEGDFGGVVVGEGGGDGGEHRLSQLDDSKGDPVGEQLGVACDCVLAPLLQHFQAAISGVSEPHAVSND